LFYFINYTKGVICVFVKNVVVNLNKMMNKIANKKKINLMNKIKIIITKINNKMLNNLFLNKTISNKCNIKHHSSNILINRNWISFRIIIWMLTLKISKYKNLNFLKIFLFKYKSLLINKELNILNLLINKEFLIL